MLNQKLIIIVTKSFSTRRRIEINGDENGGAITDFTLVGVNDYKTQQGIITR